MIPLPAEIRAELKASGSPIWDWIGNPADMSIRIDRSWDTGDMLEIMARNESFDLLIAFVHGHFHGGREGITAAKFLEEYRLNELNNKPLLAVIEERRRGGGGGDHDAWLSKLMEEVEAELMAAGIPTYPNIGRAAMAASKVIDYHRRRASR